MKKITVSLLGILLIIFAPNLIKALPWTEDDVVKIEKLEFSVAANYGIGGSGGLFTITNITKGGSIETFCVELDEYVTIGGEYKIWDISDDVVYQGGRNTNSGDQLSAGTKWLYYQFITGDSNYQNPSALQIAIWVLEDEYHDKTIDDNFWNVWGTDPNSIGQIAKNYYNTALNQSAPPADIRALDLYSNSTIVQRQSYIVMVPEPSLLILLGIGLSAVGLAARRRRK